MDMIVAPVLKYVCKFCHAVTRSKDCNDLCERNHLSIDMLKLLHGYYDLRKCWPKVIVVESPGGERKRYILEELPE